LPAFKELTTCVVHSGSIVLLWHHKWHVDTLKMQFPHLISFSRDDSISLINARTVDSLT
jgi:hypothetical protein